VILATLPGDPRNVSWFPPRGNRRSTDGIGSIPDQMGCRTQESVAEMLRNGPGRTSRNGRELLWQGLPTLPPGRPKVSNPQAHQETFGGRSISGREGLWCRRWQDRSVASVVGDPHAEDPPSIYYTVMCSCYESSSSAAGHGQPAIPSVILETPGRRIGQRGDATRAPAQAPRPGWAARCRPSAPRDWP
jgi:hypothetical protein